MPSTPHTTPKDAKAGRLNITDLMNIGIFFVINLVAGVAIAFIGIIAWAFGRDPHAEVGNKPKRVPQGK